MVAMNGYSLQTLQLSGEHTHSWIGQGPATGTTKLKEAITNFISFTCVKMSAWRKANCDTMQYPIEMENLLTHLGTNRGQ